MCCSSLETTAAICFTAQPQRLATVPSHIVGTSVQNLIGSGGIDGDGEVFENLINERWDASESR
jgi:hypothetical protein